MKRHPVYRLVAAAAATLLIAGAIGTHAVGADKRKVKNGAPPATPAPAGKVAPNVGFDAFQIVIERNIFNPNRSGRSRAAPEEKAVRTDELSLVGVVQYGQEKIAVFDGSEPAFRKGYREGETVADFRIAGITADGIQLVQDSRKIPLKVAQQLRRIEGGDWKVTANQSARVDPRAGAANGSVTSGRAAEPAPVGIPSDASEVLKRLMQKREKQLKK